MRPRDRGRRHPKTSVLWALPQKDVAHRYAAHMIAWLLRGLVMSAVHIGARVLLALAIVQWPLEATYWKTIAIASVVLVAIIWGGIDGLLDGRPCTTHWMHADELARMYPTARVDRNVLYVDDGNLITSAGTAAAYAATGTARFDMVTVNGLVPTPGALALAGIGGLVAVRRRRA